MTEQMEGQITFADLDSWFGKMSQEPSAATVEKTSKQSSQKSSKSQNRTFRVSLCLAGGGKWDKVGCIYDEMGRWSVAWRVHDAQFWGVPQRRKRISLVADFGGLSAPEVLFERKGLRWNPQQSSEKGEATSGDSETSTGESSPG